MVSEPVKHHQLDPDTAAVYRRALDTLLGRVPLLVGGAYAFERYTGIARHTKDFDIFVRPQDCSVALSELAAVGFKTELTFPHWLGKAYAGEYFIDVIFGSGNGICRVDDAWFEHAVAMEVLGKQVRCVPVEELIWSKSYIMERERYDGADIAHLLRACGKQIDWPRLLERFAEHWPVLLTHLVLFQFIYPSERDQVPTDVFLDLLDRADRAAQAPSSADKVCRGTLLSREQYLVDINDWGYADARLAPRGRMSAADIARWTAGISD